MHMCFRNIDRTRVLTFSQSQLTISIPNLRYYGNSEAGFVYWSCNIAPCELLATEVNVNIHCSYCSDVIAVPGFRDSTRKKRWQSLSFSHELPVS